MNDVEKKTMQTGVEMREKTSHHQSWPSNITLHKIIQIWAAVAFRG
jgi:hypothetical protein